MNHTQLFEELLLELQVLVNSSNKYDLIKSSRILRQLLLDGDALLHVVNREIKLSQSFIVSKKEKDVINDKFNPNIFPDRTSVLELNLKNFLSYSLGLSNNKPVTVREVIKYAAIILGGVHFKEDPKGEYEHLSSLHDSNNSESLSEILIALKNIGKITVNALIPIRDSLLDRGKFEEGKGWTAILSIKLFPMQEDEENFILDVGIDENKNRFSIYVDTRGELNFRIIDSNGKRRYLRTGKVNQAIPLEKAIIINCEFVTLNNDTLLSICVDKWNHAEIINEATFHQIGDPFHYVLGSDLLGKKHTHIGQLKTLLINRPLKDFEKKQTLDYFYRESFNAKYLYHSGNQFYHSVNHPNFT